MSLTQLKHCLNCGHNHYFDLTVGRWLCVSPRCYCRTFIESQHSLDAHKKTVRQLQTVSEKVEHILKNIPTTRNLSNKQFVFAYWDLEHDFKIGTTLTSQTYLTLTDPETICRVKRKLVENNEEYRPYDAALTYEKYEKELGILAWVVGYGD